MNEIWKIKFSDILNNESNYTVNDIINELEKENFKLRTEKDNQEKNVNKTYL